MRRPLTAFLSATTFGVWLGTGPTTVAASDLVVAIPNIVDKRLGL